jgi:LmbE family N-acetylglucosaminyl deacetylase
VAHRLAAVTAHPDDDTFGVGGIVAQHVGDIEYTVIVATSGEAGMISDPALATPENLAEVREQEEREALEVLGVGGAAVHFLGYPDGGLAGVPRQELVSKVAGLLSEARPQVVVTFGPEGVTRHDDHIAIGQAATEAFHEARDRTSADGTADGAFERLFYVAVAQSDLEAFWEAIRAGGIDFGAPDDPYMPRGVPDHTVTARVDTRETWETKARALMAHRTQAGDLDSIPAGVREQFLAVEAFVQAWPPVTDPQGPTLSSLFDGLRM